VPLQLVGGVASLSASRRASVSAFPTGSVTSRRVSVSNVSNHSGGGGGNMKVGLYKCNPVVTHSLKAPGFNP
jgi:hypothetical protein